jgi:hypothetical protein
VVVRPTLVRLLPLALILPPVRLLPPDRLLPLARLTVAPERRALAARARDPDPEVRVAMSGE